MDTIIKPVGIPTEVVPILTWLEDNKLEDIEYMCYRPKTVIPNVKKNKYAKGGHKRIGKKLTRAVAIPGTPFRMFGMFPPNVLQDWIEDKPSDKFKEYCIEHEIHVVINPVIKEEWNKMISTKIVRNGA